MGFPGFFSKYISDPFNNFIYKHSIYKFWWTDGRPVAVTSGIGNVDISTIQGVVISTSDLNGDNVDDLLVSSYLASNVPTIPVNDSIWKSIFHPFSWFSGSDDNIKPTEKTDKRVMQTIDIYFGNPMTMLSEHKGHSGLAYETHFRLEHQINITEELLNLCSGSKSEVCHAVEAKAKNQGLNLVYEGTTKYIEIGESKYFILALGHVLNLSLNVMDQPTNVTTYSLLMIEYDGLLWTIKWWSVTSDMYIYGPKLWPSGHAGIFSRVPSGVDINNDMIMEWLVHGYTYTDIEGPNTTTAVLYLTDPQSGAVKGILDTHLDVYGLCEPPERNLSWDGFFSWLHPNGVATRKHTSKKDTHIITDVSRSISNKSPDKLESKNISKICQINEKGSLMYEPSEFSRHLIGDLNGDCGVELLMDLIVEGDRYLISFDTVSSGIMPKIREDISDLSDEQILMKLRPKENQFIYSNLNLSLPLYTSKIYLTDVDADGKIDVLFVSCGDVRTFKKDGYKSVECTTSGQIHTYMRINDHAVTGVQSAWMDIFEAFKPSINDVVDVCQSSKNLNFRYEIDNFDDMNISKEDQYVVPVPSWKNLGVMQMIDFDLDGCADIILPVYSHAENTFSTITIHNNICQPGYTARWTKGHTFNTTNDENLDVSVIYAGEGPAVMNIFEEKSEIYTALISTLDMSYILFDGVVRYPDGSKYELTPGSNIMFKLNPVVPGIHNFHRRIIYKQTVWDNATAARMVGLGRVGSYVEATAVKVNGYLCVSGVGGVMPYSRLQLSVFPELNPKAWRFDETINATKRAVTILFTSISLIVILGLISYLIDKRKNK